jgi:CHAT domain-containing protein
MAMARVLPPSCDIEAKCEPVQAATPPQASRVAAETAFAEAERRRAQDTAESLRRAIEKYQEALALWRLLGDRRREADTLDGLGEVYAQLAQSSQALDYFNQALPLRRALGDRRGEAHALLHIGTSYLSLGEKQKGLDVLNQGLQLSQEIGDRSNEIATLNMMGSAYLSSSEPQRALTLYNQALALSRASGERRLEVQMVTNLGLTYEGVGELERALEFYGQALPLWRAFNDRRREATTLHNMAEVYLRVGEYQKARQYCLQALPLHRALGHQAGEAHTLEHLGTISASLNQPTKALDYYRQALALWHAADSRQKISDVLGDIGSVYATLGQPTQALQYYAQALPLARAVRQRGGEAKILAGIARVERDRGNLGEALTQAEAALSIIESGRSQLASPGLRAVFLAARRHYYDLYLDLLVRLHERHPTEGHDAAALQTSERARARSLVDLLAEAKIDVQQGIAPELKQREKATHRRISSIQSQLIQAHSFAAGESPDQTKIAALEAELKQVENERQQLEMEIRQHHPAYAELHYPAPIGLNAVQDLLDERTVLLEYFLGREGAFLFAVTKNDSVVTRLPSASTLELRVKKLRQAVAQPTRAAFSNYLLQARWLYRELIEPVKRLLAGKQALVIAPDGILHYLPFEVLVQAGRGDAGLADVRRLPYLIRDYVVSYVPSATVLAGLRAAREAGSGPRRSFLAYADPEYGEKAGPSSAALRSFFGSLQPSKLKRLAWSRTEVARIAELYSEQDATLFVGEQVSEENVKAEGRLSQYRFIHFAVHGLLNEAKPQFSGFVLSLPRTQQNPQSNSTHRVDRNPQLAEDGLLQVYEIFDLRLNAELVVLSACETGLGKEVRGEGLIGLTRAFLYAGTPSVVVSLWKVEDRSTAELMVQFYRHLRDGRVSKADALRQAQLELIRDGRFAHPYFWAPFVLVGES